MGPTLKTPFESCSSSMACDMEEVSLESSMKMKDMDETTSEASWTAVTKGEEKESEAEKPEATVPWNGVEGVSVNPEGESRHGQVRADMARKDRESQTQMEEKVEEVQSPKRKVIRVESEETQDYVRDSLNLSLKEAEEISFVPSALSIPRGSMFWCDNCCSDKASRFWQFAWVVVDDGEEAHTINLCQQCHNERLTEGSGGTESAS